LQIEVIIIGIFAGLLAGMFGISGGAIIVPSLILIFGWEMHFATGTSLATLLLPAGFLALWQYKKANLLFFKGAALIAAGIVFGNIGGSAFAINIDGALLKQLFGIFLITIGIKYSQLLHLLRYKKFLKTNDLQPENFSKLQSIKNYVFILIGVGAGLLSGLFGIGGGIIITTVLINIYKVRVKHAIAISLAAVFLPVGIGGVLLYNEQNYVDIYAAIIIAVGIEIGSAITARIAIKLNADLLRRLLGGVLATIGVYFLLQRYMF